MQVALELPQQVEIQRAIWEAHALQISKLLGVIHLLLLWRLHRDSCLDWNLLFNSHVAAFTKDAAATAAAGQWLLVIANDFIHIDVLVISIA